MTYWSAPQTIIIIYCRAERLSASVDLPMALYWRDLARLYPRAKVLYCTVLYCTVLYPLDKVVLTVRDPAKWHLSVTSTIKTKMDWMANSWLGLPLRWFASLKGRYTNTF